MAGNFSFAKSLPIYLLMQNYGSHRIADLEEGSGEDSRIAPTVLTIVVSNGVDECCNEVPVSLGPKAVAKLSKDDVADDGEQLTHAVSPEKGYLSSTESSHEQCRVCQHEKEEALIELGCQCRGGLAKAHRSCIDAWFRTRGSNKCEICQQLAANVEQPESHPSTNYWFLRVDPGIRRSAFPHEREMGCFSPLWVAFCILIGGLLLDVLISITLGVSALPVNIIIGVIVVLGLGTALRLALGFCHEWSLRRLQERVETNVNLGYHPAL